jgi:hypothetical protein
VTETSTVTRSGLTETDRALIDSYSAAVRPHIETMNKVIREPKFSSVPAHTQAKALSEWWQALELLAERVTPSDAPSSRYLDDQRVAWFRARQAALFACVDYCERYGLLGEPSIPRPEDPQTGVVGDGYGYVGFSRIDERLACIAPVDIRLRVGTDGSVAILRPDAASNATEAQLQRRSTAG